jgi:hypothetical protein
MNPDVANASSFIFTLGTPSACAAFSLSRRLISTRPNRARRRLRPIKNEMTRKPRHTT